MASNWKIEKAFGYVTLFIGALSTFWYPLFAAALTFLGTVVLAKSDWSFYRLTSWPRLTLRDQKIVAQALKGSISRIYVFHHSETAQQQFAASISAVLREAGASVIQRSGFTAPAAGIRIDYQSSRSPTLIVNAFKLVNVVITVGDRYDHDEESCDFRLSIGDTT